MAIDMREKVQVVTETTGYHNEEVRIQHVNRNPESAEKKFEDLEAVKSFRKAWPTVTDDNYLTLFGFRRFRTAHLLNLRFLEKEVDQIDHQIFQSGLKLDHSPSTVDRLGLGYAKKDLITQGIDERINKELVMKLRELLKQYDDSLASFNNIMMMEIFALADNSLQANLRTDFNPYETYKTRLVRVDLARRNGPRDVLRHSFRKGLRYFWFFIRLKGFEIPTPSTYASATALEANLKRTYQKTACIAEYMTRFVVALLAGAFLVVPLIVMSYQPSNQAHLITISICIFVFSLLVSLVSKASNEQIMIAAAGYAAVLAVFLSNTPAA